MLDPNRHDRFMHPRYICWDCRSDVGCMSTVKDTAIMICPFCHAANDCSNLGEEMKGQRIDDLIGE